MGALWSPLISTRPTHLLPVAPVHNEGSWLKGLLCTDSCSSICKPALHNHAVWNIKSGINGVQNLHICVFVKYILSGMLSDLHCWTMQYKAMLYVHKLFEKRVFQWEFIHNIRLEWRMPLELSVFT